MAQSTSSMASSLAGFAGFDNSLVPRRAGGAGWRAGSRAVGSRSTARSQWDEHAGGVAEEAGAEGREQLGSGPHTVLSGCPRPPRAKRPQPTGGLTRAQLGEVAEATA